MWQSVSYGHRQVLAVQRPSPGVGRPLRTLDPDPPVTNGRSWRVQLGVSLRAYIGLRIVGSPFRLRVDGCPTGGPLCRSSLDVLVEKSKDIGLPETDIRVQEIVSVARRFPNRGVDLQKVRFGHSGQLTGHRLAR